MFIDKERAFSFASMMKMVSKDAGFVASDTVVSTTSFLYVKGKLLYVYLYTTFENTTDIDWARSATRFWIGKILAENGH